MSRRAPLIAAGAALVVLVLVFVVVVLPKFREAGEVEDRLDEARNREATLQADLARLEGLRDEAQRIRRRLARFRRQVPAVADLPGLVNLLQDAADTSEVDFFSVSPQDPVVEQAQAATIPASIQVIGGFFAVDRFLFELEELQRAAKVTTVDVTEGPDGAPQLQVSLAVEFYTTDTEAGPGAAAEAEPEPTPEESPEPGEEAAPEETPSPETPPVPPEEG